MLLGSYMVGSPVSSRRIGDGGVTLCGSVGMCDKGIANSAWDAKSSSVRPAAVCLPQHGLKPGFCREKERLADWHQGFNLLEYRLLRYFK